MPQFADFMSPRPPALCLVVGFGGFFPRLQLRSFPVKARNTYVLSVDGGDGSLSKCVCVCVSPPKHSARTPILFARVASLMKTFQRLDFKHNFKKLWTANQQQSQDRAVR